MTFWPAIKKRMQANFFYNGADFFLGRVGIPINHELLFKASSTHFIVNLFQF